VCSIWTLGVYLLKRLYQTGIDKDTSLDESTFKLFRQAAAPLEFAIGQSKPF
jgi:hypothetical protein